MKNENLTIRVDLNSENLVSALSEVLKLAPELLDGIVGLLDIPGELAFVNCDYVATSGTGDLRIRIEPSNRLLGFLPTTRPG